MQRVDGAGNQVIPSCSNCSNNSLRVGLVSRALVWAWKIVTTRLHRAINDR